MLSGTLGLDNPLSRLPYAEDISFNLYSKQHKSADISQLTSLIRVSVSFTRYTTGLIDKTSDTSSG